MILTGKLVGNRVVIRPAAHKDRSESITAAKLTETEAKYLESVGRYWDRECVKAIVDLSERAIAGAATRKDLSEAWQTILALEGLLRREGDGWDSAPWDVLYEQVRVRGAEMEAASAFANRCAGFA